MSDNYDDQLREALGDDLLPLLDRAQAAAKEFKIFERKRGYQGYYTIRAALILATAVWEADGGRE